MKHKTSFLTDKKKKKKKKKINIYQSSVCITDASHIKFSSSTRSVHKVHKVTLANVSIHEGPTRAPYPPPPRERTEFIRWFRVGYYFTTLNKSSSVGFTRINVTVP